MVKPTRLVATSELKSTLWQKTIDEKSSQPCVNYDPIVDELIVLFFPVKTRKIVHYIDENVAFLYLPENKEIVGFQIESFEKSFLPENKEMQKVWRLSETGTNLNDFGDLIITFRKQNSKVIKELSGLTRSIARKQGLEIPASV